MKRVAEFQVTMKLVPFEARSSEALQDAADRALATLTSKARTIAVGPVAGVHLRDGLVEVEFTVEAPSASDVYPKLAEVINVLGDAGFDFLESSEVRSDRELQLQPA